MVYGSRSQARMMQSGGGAASRYTTMCSVDLAVQGHNEGEAMKRFVHLHKLGYWFASASPCVQDASLQYVCVSEEDAFRVCSVLGLMTKA